MRAAGRLRRAVDAATERDARIVDQDREMAENSAAAAESAATKDREIDGLKRRVADLEARLAA